MKYIVEYFSELFFTLFTKFGTSSFFTQQDDLSLVESNLHFDIINSFSVLEIKSVILEFGNNKASGPNSIPTNL